LVALAARLGDTRLIDNVGISVVGDSVDVDLGTISADPLAVAP
jgi:hypothetical protein